jgi:glutaredoxin
MNKTTVPGIIRKIIEADDDTFIIYYRNGCPYSMRALSLLTGLNMRFKGYDVSKINGEKNNLLKNLRTYSSKIAYDPSHTTVPIIFRNGVFIGGCRELERYLQIS